MPSSKPPEPKQPEGTDPGAEDAAWARQALIGALTLAMLDMGSLEGLTDPRRWTVRQMPTIFN